QHRLERADERTANEAPRVADAEPRAVEQRVVVRLELLPERREQRRIVDAFVREVAAQPLEIRPSRRVRELRMILPGLERLRAARAVVLPVAIGARAGDEDARLEEHLREEDLVLVRAAELLLERADLRERLATHEQAADTRHRAALVL